MYAECSKEPEYKDLVKSKSYEDVCKIYDLEPYLQNAMTTNGIFKNGNDVNYINYWLKWGNYFILGKLYFKEIISLFIYKIVLLGQSKNLKRKQDEINTVANSEKKKREAWKYLINKVNSVWLI